MIRLFFIKNKLKNRKLINNNDDEIVKKYKDIAKLKKEEVLEKFNSNEETGLCKQALKISFILRPRRGLFWYLLSPSPKVPLQHKEKL